MKTSSKLIQLFLSIGLSLSFSQTGFSENNIAVNKLEILIESGVYDLTTQEILEIHKNNNNEIGEIPTEDSLLVTVATFPSADVQFPDANQKITFAAIAGAIAFLFLFLALFGTGLMRDDDHMHSLNFKTLSPIKIGVVCSFYLIFFSILLSYWVHGNFPKPNASLLIFAAISLLTAIFHHLLKKQQNNRPTRHYTLLQKSFNYLLPILSLLITAYLIFPVVTKAYFSEAPELLIITYLIISLFHIGVRTFNSSISYSPTLKNFIHPGLKQNAAA